MALNLRELRKQAGLTQAQAAERIGVHLNHVVRLEAGGVNATLRLLVSAALCYRVPIARLLEKKPEA